MEGWRAGRAAIGGLEGLEAGMVPDVENQWRPRQFFRGDSVKDLFHLFRDSGVLKFGAVDCPKPRALSLLLPSKGWMKDPPQILYELQR